MNTHALGLIEETCRTFAEEGLYRIDGIAVPGLPNQKFGIKDIADYLIHRDTPITCRDSIWRVLIERARGTDQNWNIIAIRLAIPGIRRAISRAHAIFPSYGLGDLETEAICVFTEALDAIEVGQPNLCSKLCQRVFSSLRTLLRDELRDIKTATRIEFESRVPSILTDTSTWFLPKPFEKALLIDLKQQSSVLYGLTRHV